MCMMTIMMTLNVKFEVVDTELHTLSDNYIYNVLCELYTTVTKHNCSQTQNYFQIIMIFICFRVILSFIGILTILSSAYDFRHTVILERGNVILKLFS